MKFQTRAGSFFTVHVNIGHANEAKSTATTTQTDAANYDESYSSENPHVTPIFEISSIELIKLSQFHWKDAAILNVIPQLCRNAVICFTLQ